MGIGSARRFAVACLSGLLVLELLAAGASFGLGVEGVVRVEGVKTSKPAVRLHLTPGSHEQGLAEWQGPFPGVPVLEVEPDPEGRFGFELPGPGAWSIRIEDGSAAPLFLELQAEDGAGTRPGPESPIRLPTAVLKPRSTDFRVQVVDPRGQPLEDAWARVGPTCPAEAESLAWCLAPWIGRSSDSGWIDFRWPAGSTPELVVVAEGYAVARFHLASDSDPRILELEPGAALDVLVLDRRGRPVPEALVRLDPGGVPVGRTDEDGSAPLRWTANDEHLEVSTESEQVRTALSDFDPRSARPWVVQLEGETEGDGEGGYSIRGSVTDEDGEPIPWTEISGWPSRTGSGRDPMIGAGRDVNGRLSSPSMVRVRSLEDGSFELTDLEGPGPWNVQAWTSMGFSPKARYAIRALSRQERSGGEAPLVFVLERARRIHGKVLSTAGEPVPGAEVLLVDPLERLASREISGEAVTDNAGHFSFDRSVPNLAGLRLVVGAPQFRIEEIPLPDPEEDLGALDIVLSPWRPVRGVVLDPDGEPVAHAGIHIGIDDSEGSYLPFLMRYSMTDDHGKFELSYLPPGTYELAVDHPGFPRQVARETLGDEAQEIEIRLEARNRYPVLGRLSSPDGRVAGSELSLRRASRSSASDSGVVEARTEADGSFSFGAVPVGSYEIRLHRDSRRIAPRSRRLVVEGPTEVVVELVPPVTLTGSISGLDPEELASLKVSERESGAVGTVDVVAETYRIEGVHAGPVRVLSRVPAAEGEPRRIEKGMVIDPEWQEAVLDLVFGQELVVTGEVRQEGAPFVLAKVVARGAGGYQRSQTDAEGQFALRGLLPGAYTLDLFEQGSASGGRKNLVLSRELVLESDRHLEIELPRRAAIVGRISSPDGSPISGAGVRVLMDLERYMRGAITDGKGRFEIEDLPAGSWRLQASRQGYSTVQQEVRLEGEDLELNLEMEPAEDHAIRIRRPDGTLPESVRLVLLGPDGRAAWSLAGAPDAEGLLETSGAPRGEGWRLWVETDGGAFALLEPGFSIPPRGQELQVRAAAEVWFEIPDFREVPTAELELFDSSGLPFEPPVPTALRNGFAHVRYLPAGEWLVVARFPAGSSAGVSKGERRWRFTVEPGARIRVEIP